MRVSVKGGRFTHAGINKFLYWELQALLFTVYFIAHLRELTSKLLDKVPAYNLPFEEMTYLNLDEKKKTLANYLSF